MNIPRTFKSGLDSQEAFEDNNYIKEGTPRGKQNGSSPSSVSVEALSHYLVPSFLEKVGQVIFSHLDVRESLGTR